MKRDEIQIAPSILSADFGRLAEEAKRIEEAGADAIHVDIMDGHFVPNLTLGPRALGAINRATSLFLDVHIMIYRPFDFIERFVEAGADRLTFHFEATEDVEETIDYIKRCGIEAGVAFSPETSVEFVFPYLPKLDLVLLMSVNPGFGGQEFISETIEKIALIRSYCNEHKLKNRNGGAFNISVDGGINNKTAPLCIQAGANVLVSGHYLFNEVENMAEGIQILKRGKE